jgi:CheY-like chemotaxis protein
VLLVEDETDVRVLAEAYLESFGYTVISAADGTTAMAALTANPRIDLLLSDIILPGAMDGIAIAAHVRATRPEIKIVYVSRADPEMPLPAELIKKRSFARFVVQVRSLGQAAGREVVLTIA